MMHYAPNLQTFYCISHYFQIMDYGWQIRVENKVMIKGGILCLNPKVVTLLGGVVQSLYEEWEMNKKYSGFSRSSLSSSQENGTGGPPPFEKLQIEAPSTSRSAHPGQSYSE